VLGPVRLLAGQSGCSVLGGAGVVEPDCVAESRRALPLSGLRRAHRASFETKELLGASFLQWASEIKRERVAVGDSAGDDLELVMLDVARIRRAARTLLMDSRSFRKLLRELDGREVEAPRLREQ
jgi:hypothetical protein